MKYVKILISFKAIKNLYMATFLKIKAQKIVLNIAKWGLQIKQFCCVPVVNYGNVFGESSFTTFIILRDI